MSIGSLDTKLYLSDGTVLDLEAIADGEYLRRSGSDIVGATVSAGTTPAGTTIVATSGGDYATIGAALAASVSGDTIIVYPGTYAENITIPDGIRVVGYPAAKNVVISGADTTGARVTFAGNGTLRELSVQTPSSGSNPAIDASGLASGKLAVVSNVVVQGGGGTGPGIAGAGSGILLTLQGFLHDGGTLGTFCDISSGTAIIQEIVLNVGTSTTGFALSGGVLQIRDMVVQPSTLYTTTNLFDISGGVLSVVGLQSSASAPAATNAAVKVSGDGVSMSFRACDLIAQTWDWEIDGSLTGTGTHLDTAACSFRTERLSFPIAFAQNASIQAQFNDEGDFNDTLVRLVSELSVGLPEVPKESSFGEGVSSIEGMVVKTYDGVSTYVTATDELKSSSGSTAPLLAGTGSGNIFYLGNTRRKFPAFKPTLTQAMVWGSGTGVWEYSTGGGGWQEFNILYRDSAANGSQYAQVWGTLTDATQPSKVTFCTLPSLSDWVTDAVDGVTAYWVRFRLTGAISTVPIAERIKLAANSVELDNTGIQYHGDTLPTRSLQVHQTMADDLSGASPGNGTINISPLIALTPVDNRFNNTQDDGFGGIVDVPSGIDTSAPVTFTVLWYPTGSGSGEVHLDLHIAEPILVGSDINSGTIPEVKYGAWNTQRPSGSNQTGVYPIVEATTSGQVYMSTIDIDLSDALPGTAFAYALTRFDHTNPDAYNGGLIVACVKAEARFWA